MSATIALESPRPGAWRAVIIILILTSLSFLDRQIIALMVADIRSDLQISDFQLSLLQGVAFALVYALAGLPFGYAADVGSRRIVVFVGVLIWAAAATVCGLVHTFAALLIARAGVGLGEAALGPSAHSLLSDLFPPRRLALAISVCAIGTLVGASLALIVGSYVLEWAQQGGRLPFAPNLRPWQITFVLTGAPGLVLALLAFALPDPPRQKQADASWRDLASFISRNRRLMVCHFGGFACCMLLVYAQLAWLPTILQRVHDWPISQIGLVLAGFGVTTGLVGLLVNGLVVDAMFSRGVTDAHLRYFVWVMAIVALLGAAAAFAYWDPLLYLAALALPSALLNFIGVGAAALQIVTPAHLRGRMAALFLAFISLVGITAGPSVPAFFTDFVFAQDDHVPFSLASTYLVFAPLALMLFALGLRPARRALLEASA